MIAKTLKLPRSTVNRVLKRYKETSSTERKPGSETNLVPKNQDLKKKIVRSFQQNPGLSDTDRAKRYGTSKFTVQRIRQKAGYKSYRTIKIPNRSDVAKRKKTNVIIGRTSLESFMTTEFRRRHQEYELIKKT